ncbi:peptidase S9 [Marinicella pacifica]|uniref:Peptidase S9 n=1 Tax=Marinicella pacifica TaxID=1171543 RepID=A0A917CMD2_9GAMM|nr:prolyl oligopeptidase family serine peptidase [Marinicella pacifica]GGF91978.1 peptidase S9 [Marinicella pacifica]
MFKILLFIPLLISPVLSQAEPVPVENFAAKVQFKSVKISPDGKHLAYTFEEGDRVKLGTMNIKTKKGIYAFDVGADREIVQFDWVNNNRLYFLGADITGWLDGAPKNYRAYFANLNGKKRKSIPVQYSNIVSFLENEPDYVLINKYFEDGVKVHKMNVHTLKTDYQAVEPKTVGGMHSTIQFISFDHNDNARLAYEFDPVDKKNYDDDILYIHVRSSNGDWKSLKVNNQRKEKPVFSGLGYNKANDKFYFISNYDLPGKGANGLFEYDFKTNEINLLFRHPDADVISGAYGKNEEFIGAYYEAGYPNYYYLEDDDVAEEVNFHKSIRASFPQSTVSIGTYTKDKNLTTLFVRSDRNPGDYYIFNKNQNKVSYLASVLPSIDKNKMAKVEPFTIQTRDGLKMYGQLTIPKNKELKNLPLIVFPHGGPYGVMDTWRWYPRPQLFANRGYLVLQLNYRGSSGYGSEFEEAGYHEWGAKMQDDITDATLWAIDKGYADKNRICIHGISYGGYAAMQAVVKEPDLYKCSIPDAGTYELAYHMKSTDMFKGNNSLKEWFFTRMLGENFEELNKERSPVYHLDKLKAKLMIVHGTKDVRVTIGNAEILEEKLKEKNIRYETFYKKDGHGFQKVPYRIELYNKMLDFLDQHIGEKSQSSN